MKTIQHILLMTIMIISMATLSACHLLCGEQAEPENCKTCYVDFPDGTRSQEDVCSESAEQAFMSRHEGYSPYCY